MQAWRGGFASSLVGHGTVMRPQHNLESLSQRPVSAPPVDFASTLDFAPTLGSASTLGSSPLTSPRYSLLYVHLFLRCICASGMLSCHTQRQHSWYQSDTPASMQSMVIVRCNLTCCQKSGLLVHYVARAPVSWGITFAPVMAVPKSLAAKSCNAQQCEYTDQCWWSSALACPSLV